MQIIVTVLVINHVYIYIIIFFAWIGVELLLLLIDFSRLC